MDPTNPGGGGGSAGCDGGGSGSGAGGGDANTGSASVVDLVDELDELWPSRPPSSAADMLAAIWVANPATSDQWTHGLGAVE